MKFKKHKVEAKRPSEVYRISRARLLDLLDRLRGKNGKKPKREGDKN